jgi:hypothetical protein
MIIDFEKEYDDQNKDAFQELIKKQEMGQRKSQFSGWGPTQIKTGF